MVILLNTQMQRKYSVAYRFDWLSFGVPKIKKYMDYVRQIINYLNHKHHKIWRNHLG